MKTCNNRGIGFLRDDIDLLTSAMAYILQYEQNLVKKEVD